MRTCCGDLDQGRDLGMERHRWVEGSGGTVSEIECVFGEREKYIFKNDSQV